jgi:SynChlorMet cassette radical SAM/SPASM protein ScmF
MHPDILALIEHVRAEGLRMVVETNGVLCTSGLAEQIAGCQGAFVSVSLDGADAATHEWVRGVEGSFDAALNGVRNLVAAGLRPQIIMSVLRRNVAQMEPLVRLAESLGAGSVKFNLIQPTERGERLHAEGETLSVSELVDLGRWVERELRAATALPVHYDHPTAFRPLGRMFGDTGDGCSVCGILGVLGVLADGSYALCGIGTSLPEMVFGHAAEDALEGVWRNAPVLTQLRAGLPGRLTGICGECIMRSRCIGSCIAQNVYRSGSLWAPFWYCEMADHAGLFPATRRGRVVQ